jgi:hypothetical protein
MMVVSMDVNRISSILHVNVLSKRCIQEILVSISRDPRQDCIAVNTKMKT